MSSVNLDYRAKDNEKNQICIECKKNRDYITKKFKFQTTSIEDNLSKESNDFILNLNNNLSINDIIRYEIEGIPIGKFTLYETIINNKLSSESVPENLYLFVNHQFLNSLKVYFSISEIFKNNKIDAFFSYNALYSVNRIASAVAENNNIPFYTLHASNHLNRSESLKQITIFRGLSLSLPNLFPVNLSPSIVEKNRRTPCGENDLKLNFKHTSSFYKSDSLWVYSNAVNRISTSILKKKLNIKNDQKVLLAVMRSPDEMIAAEAAGVDLSSKQKGLFETQIEWLKWLNNFALNNLNFFIIFRVHPREFPNKRESVTSENGYAFLQMLEGLELSNNFYVNLPNDSLSLYDLIKITDLLLNNTSSVGIEASLFGIPVLGYGESFPPFDPILQTEARTLEEYDGLIRTLSSEEWDFNRIVIAYRWLRLVNYLLPIDISDCYKSGKFGQFLSRKKIFKKFFPKVGFYSKFFGRIKLSKPKNSSKIANSLSFDGFNQKIIYDLDDVKEKNEIFLLKKDLIRRANSISSKTDYAFLEKINKLLNYFG
jgi:hypothetical protein